MTTRYRRAAFALSLVGAAVALAAAGCTTATTATPPAATSAAPASATPPATSAAAKAGCPVDAATLEKAFKANTSLASAIILGNGLQNVVCFQDFAVAHTTPTDVDAATVLFSYDKTTGTWKAVTAGTAIDCSEVAPPAVVANLPGCA